MTEDKKIRFRELLAAADAAAPPLDLEGLGRKQKQRRTIKRYRMTLTKKTLILTKMLLSQRRKRQKNLCSDSIDNIFC